MRLAACLVSSRLSTLQRLLDRRAAIIEEIGIDLFVKVYEFLKSSPAGVGTCAAGPSSAVLCALRWGSALAVAHVEAGVVFVFPFDFVFVLAAESRAKITELQRIVGGNKQKLATCFLIECLVWDESVCE